MLEKLNNQGRKVIKAGKTVSRDKRNQRQMAPLRKLSKDERIFVIISDDGFHFLNLENFLSLYDVRNVSERGRKSKCSADL